MVVAFLTDNPGVFRESLRRQLNGNFDAEVLRNDKGAEILGMTVAFPSKTGKIFGFPQQ
jgi:hypothetical protein